MKAVRIERFRNKAQEADAKPRLIDAEAENGSK